MTFEEYQAIDAINWTTLKHMRTSPAHYKWHLENPTPHTASMELGTAVHCAILEPERFAREFVPYRKRRAGKDWDEFEAANVTRTILRGEDFDTALAIVAAVRRHPVANHLLEVGEAEKVLVWTDDKTGLKCKGRADWVNGIGLVDLKTSFDITQWKFSATAARQGYHAQLAFYRRGLFATGIEVPTKLLAVETEPPFDVLVYSLSEDELWAGECLVDMLLAKVKACQESNVWPGRSAEEVPLQLPGWAFTGEAAYSGDDSGLGDLVIGGAA